MEGNVAFYFLNDLMYVSVQHGDRAESAQQAHELIRISGAPTPGLIDGPEGHVGKDHNGCACRTSPEVRRQPGELITPQGPKATRLELQYIDERDKVHAAVINAVIALVVRSLTESVEVFRDGRIGGVVLARYGVQLGRAQTGEHLLSQVKFGGPG